MEEKKAQAQKKPFPVTGLEMGWPQIHSQAQQKSMP